MLAARCHYGPTPYNRPRSLNDDEVYALTAYLLALNKLIGDGDVMDAKTLPQVKMPNRDNFIMPFPGSAVGFRCC